jgi:hypothetical protein
MNLSRLTRMPELYQDEMIILDCSYILSEMHIELMYVNPYLNNMESTADEIEKSIILDEAEYYIHVDASDDSISAYCLKSGKIATLSAMTVGPKNEVGTDLKRSKEALNKDAILIPALEQNSELLKSSEIRMAGTLKDETRSGDISIYYI